MTTHTSTPLADKRYFCEGPRWHEGRFWFSDFYAHEVCSVGLGGDVRVELSLGDEQPSGLGWLPGGDLLVVGMTKRQVLRRSADKTLAVHAELAVHADLKNIATFHANDMLVTPEGDAYVGNFGFDLDAFLTAHGVEGLLGALATDPSPFLGKLAHVKPDGTASVAAEPVLFPNGMVLLDGGRTLVVAQTLAFELTAFDRAPDGTLSNRRVWASLKESMVAPDGICVDAQGGIWVANALAPVVIRVEEGGQVTDTVTTSQNAYACALGGPKGRHLLICTAPTSVHSLAAAEASGRLEMVEV
jgi:sugar lactone lactonase YvrE